jgi:hypothetical protein
MKPSEKPHYVNNKQFSHAVVDYVKEVNDAENSGTEPPKVPDYIAMSFMKIAEGLSHKANFIRYTYRDEMVMDAVENCLKAIKNYNINAATRTGNPNAFAYFTQISWYAFLRRIEKEKRQQDIKMKYINQSPFEDFAVSDQVDEASLAAAHQYVDSLRVKIDQVRNRDAYYDAIEKEEKKKKRKSRASSTDSDLGEIFS